MSRPLIVCLIGSTKFKATFREVDAKETMKGNIVLSISVFKQYKNRDLTEKEVQLLMTLHKHKIDLADKVLVLNVGGYIGEGGKEEIAYARNMRKKIVFLEEVKSE